MIKAARLSTIRLIREIAAEIIVPEGISLSYVDWDQHADFNALPNTDLYGLTGMGIAEEEKQHALVFGVTLATYDDPNLFRMVEMSDLFYRKLRAERTFDVYDPATAISVGKIIIENGTAVTPVSRVEARVVVNVSVSASMALDPEYAASH